jgi:LytS/YehU family sensor histidine kinase
LLEAERLKGEKVVAEFELLKQQVNPQFLFDSLHLLEALIDDDEEVALDFTEKLSQTYRYILQHKDEDLVDLQIEVSFVKQYLFLLQHQLPHSFDINWQIDTALAQRQIIPFSIQYILLPLLEATPHPAQTKVHISTTTRQHLLLDIQGTTPALEAVNASLLPLKQKYAYLSNLALRVEQINAHAIRVYLPLLDFVTGVNK